MSEKIYACLLRLFPSHFLESYGEAALQLFRDRARDERGFFLTLRLWVDLLLDLGISIPREYRCTQPALIVAAAPRRLDGAPSFIVLEDESPRREALVFGGVLSWVALSMFAIVPSYAGNRRPLNSLAGQRQRAADARELAFRSPAPQVGDDAEEETIASTSRQLPARGATRLRSDEAKPNDSQSNMLLLPDGSRSPQVRPPQPQDHASRRIGAPVEGAKLDAAERHRVIAAAVANLKQHYFDPVAAQKIADALQAQEKNGDYDAVADRAGLADLVTRQMRDVGHDLHLELAYSQAPLPASRFDALGRPLAPTPEGLARYRKAMEESNCTFEKTEILPHNIGYLKLNSFPDPSICQSTATAAMASLNHTDAVIFDLRENGGGSPDMVMLIAAYLFDHPEYMYNPREGTTQRSWTQSPVPGNRLADKPVYVLTSARSFSAAEHFSYDLKALKRATLVGETTGGAAHAGVFHRIDDHFGMGIPETKAINPYSKTDWEGAGVEPDVKVKATDALETAEKLAVSKLQKK